MLYRIVGVDDRDVVIEFRKDNKEVIFETYQEAEEYLKKIKQEGVIPNQYRLQIKE